MPSLGVSADCNKAYLTHAPHIRAQKSIPGKLTLTKFPGIPRATDGTRTRDLLSHNQVFYR